MPAHQGPSFGRVEARLGAIVHQRKSEAALQRHLAVAELVHHEAEVSGLKRLLRCGRGGDTLRFILRIVDGVLRQQRCNEVGVILHVLGRAREPLLDRAIQQAVRKQEKKDDRTERQQQRSQHHVAAELRAEQPVLRSA